VLIRADIFSKAGELGLDISYECNLALADRMGIDYRQKPFDSQVISDPVIFDADTQTKELKSTSQKTPSPDIHPVINADDPAAITKVLKAKRQLPVKTMAEVPVSKESSATGTGITKKIPAQAATFGGKGKAVAPDKKRKDEWVKKFVAVKLIRVDADDAMITKDDLYLAFSRWCRDHRITAIPERKVFATSLKNKFAFTEKMVNGTPYWVNIRFK
ncbi:MAG: hypothetical protein LUQ54_06530, partial [Methanoregula sp.]|nr:hypothetical protein [Methanoregula sp.]